MLITTRSFMTMTVALTASLAIGGAAVSVAHAGLQPLSDEELGGVSGQDGLVIDFTSDAGFSADQILWETDRGGAEPQSCAGGLLDQHACTRFAGISLVGLGEALNARLTLDVGGDGSGSAALALASEWNRSRLRIDDFNYSTGVYDASAAGHSFGSLALDTQGRLDLVNIGGPFFMPPTVAEGRARFNLDTSGDLFYRQGGAGSPELSLADMEFAVRYSTGAAAGHGEGDGVVALDEYGLLLAAPYVDMTLGFDVAFNASPSDFDVSGRESMLMTQWQGGLTNASLRIGGGGLGYGTYESGGVTWHDHRGLGGGARSDGLNILAEFDFDSDLAWVIGEAGGDRNRARLSDYRRLGNAPGPMLSMPVILDVVQNGVGATGLCAGGGFASGIPVQTSCESAGGVWLPTGVAAGEAALAALIRDGRLHAYNQKVEYINQDGTNEYDWTLVFTFGKLDADIFFYPRGRADGLAAVDTNTGLRTDITFLAQSPGFWDAANSSDPAVRASAGDGWETNTHFLVGDTNVAGTGAQFAAGIVNADLLWQVRDMYLRINDGDSAYPELPAGFWMQTDNQATYRFRGILGGANLEDMSEVTSLGLVDINLNTDRFIFVLSPGEEDEDTGSAPVGFDGLLDLDAASLSVAEVSSPQSAFQISNISGRIGWQDGRIGLRNQDGQAQLSISNRLLFGESATFGGATGGAPVIGDVSFGAENFGRMVLPAGQWRSDITMKIPGQ